MLTIFFLLIIIFFRFRHFLLTYNSNIPSIRMHTITIFLYTFGKKRGRKRYLNEWNLFAFLHWKILCRRFRKFKKKASCNLFPNVHCTSYIIKSSILIWIQKTEKIDFQNMLFQQVWITNIKRWASIKSIFTYSLKVRLIMYDFIISSYWFQKYTMMNKILIKLPKWMKWKLP